MDALEAALPHTITGPAIRSGNELVLPFAEAQRAVGLASEHRIAVLGVEAFRILEDGLGVETYSGYGFSFDGNWPAYVRVNNDAALSFMAANTMGTGYGYILTATAEEEFNRLQT